MALRKDIKKLEKERDERRLLEKREEEALAVIEREIPFEKLTGDDTEKLLLWHGIPRKDQGNAKEKKQKWKEISQNKKTPPVYQKWTAEDDMRLQQLCAQPIQIGDTALGRLQQTHKRELEASYKKMSPNSKDSFIKRLKHLDNSISDNDNNSNP